MQNKRILAKAGLFVVVLIILLSTASGEIIGNYKQEIKEDLGFELEGYEMSNDTTPPTVEIVRPKKGLYIFDRFIIPRIIRITQAIGKLTISVNATDNESGINRVEFYRGPLGRKMFANVTEAPYNATWKIDRPRFIHVHILKVVAYDNCDNSATDIMLVRKII